jgi:hypothetical protein
MEQRIEAAIAQLPDIAQARKRNNGQPGDAPVSTTTDADARNMTMGDGTFRPACIVRSATVSIKIVRGLPALPVYCCLQQLAALRRRCQRGQAPRGVFTFKT